MVFFNFDLQQNTYYFVELYSRKNLLMCPQQTPSNIYQYHKMQIYLPLHTQLIYVTVI